MVRSIISEGITTKVRGQPDRADGSPYTRDDGIGNVEIDAGIRCVPKWRDLASKPREGRLTVPLGRDGTGRTSSSHVNRGS